MAYYDPLAPSLSATRFEIERSISALQSKLRQRRELDMDIDYLRNEELERRCELASYHRDALNRVSYTDLPPRSYYAEDRYFAERSRYAMEQEEKNLTHAHRMKQLQLEQMQLEKERLRSTVAFFGGKSPQYSQPPQPYSFQRNNDYIAYEDDSDLIRKYQDGTRAQQIRNQLDSYGNSRSGTKSSNELYRQPISRPLVEDFKPDYDYDYEKRNKYSSANKAVRRNPNQFATAEQRSPYQKLDYESDKKGEPNLKIFRNEGIRSPPKQIQQPKQPKQLQSPIQPKYPKQTFYQKIDEENEQQVQKPVYQPTSSNKKRARSKSFKQFNVSRENWTNSSMINKAYKPKSGRKSGQKSPLKMSVLERSRTGNLSIEESGILKIKNRLKVSEIIFQDSKFRNIKHETSHLHMTFQNELKIRKQIKDKINNHPVVLRKHAMVVQ